MKIKLLAILLTTPVVFSAQATTDSHSFSTEKIDAEMSMGTLSGKTKERVYEPDEGGRKISQLDWRYNNAAIIKGAVNWNVMDRISVGASGWSTLDSRGADMTDRDWADSRNPGQWTDESSHPGTRLNYANEYDLFIKAWLLNETDYRLGMMAGYQENRYSFSASGGSYIYSEDGGFRNETGTFPTGERVIGYKQRFKMPYIGLTGSYRYDRFEFGGSFKYSDWVRATDNDEHYGREITFRSKIKNQSFYSVSANAGYFVTPEAKVYIEGTWSRITNKKGDASLYDRTDNTSESHKNSAGIESYSFMTTVGLRYTF